MPRIPLLLFLLLAVQSCEKESISPNLAQKSQGLTHEEPLKCLEPYNGPLRGLFIQNQQDLYETINWDRSKEIRSEKVQLSQTLYAIRMTEVGSEFTGRFMIYQDLGGQPKPLGSVADCKNLRYDYPSLRMIPKTNWLESGECVMAGTGVATCWSRYWIIKDHGIHERLAVPTSGHQSMGHGTPWCEFALEPVPAQFSDNEIVFTFSASCELIYAPEGVTEASVIVLPEIRRTIYFEKSASGSMSLNEKKSNLTLREFQVLTNAQLEFGTEFWEVYGDDIERIAQGSERESLRAWIDANNSESWDIPDKIRITLSRQH